MEKSPRTILLVEDNIVSATVEKISLEKEGFTIIHATSGEKAIETVTSRERDIDLILMDIDLGKGMDGTEAASVITREFDIPTIFLSSHTEKKILDKISLIHSYGYVTKNAGIDVLMAAIRTALKLHETLKQLKNKNKPSPDIEKIYQLITENIRDSFWMMDLNFKTTWISPSVRKNRGFTFEELRDMPLEKQMTPDSYNRLLKLFGEKFTSEKMKDERTDLSASIEIELFKKDGSTFWSDIIVTLLRDGDNNPLGYLVVGRTVDDRKKTEKLLHIQHELGIRLSNAQGLNDALEFILDAACQVEGIDCGGIYIVDTATGGIDLVAHRGLSEHFVKKNLHFDASSKRVQIISRGKPFYFEKHELINQPQLINDEADVSAFAAIPVMHEGRMIAVFNLASRTREKIAPNEKMAIETVASQIGGAIARIRATDSLRESEMSFRTSSEISTTGIYIYQEGRFKYFNPALLKIVGYTPEEAAGMDPFKQIHPDDLPVLCERINRRLAGEALPTGFTFRLIHRDGRPIRVSQVGARIMLNGKPTLVGNITSCENS